MPGIASQISLLIENPIGKSAWLRAPAPIAAPASEDTAEKTLTGIAVTHGSMNKTFQFQS